MDDQFYSTQTSAGVEQPAETDQSEVQADNTDASSNPTVNPTTRRKSFRRATITRRSLPALPNQYQSEMSVSTLWPLCTLFCIIMCCIAHLLWPCSFVQEHKHIFITAGET